MTRILLCAAIFLMRVVLFDLAANLLAEGIAGLLRVNQQD